MEYVWVGLGGVLGVNARYLMTKMVTERVGTSWPWATFSINILGAFAIGVILTLLANRGIQDPTARLVLVVGFLGGFTTFSSYTWEAVSLMQRGAWQPALLYIAGSNLLGLAACIAGMAVARTIT